MDAEADPSGSATTPTPRETDDESGWMPIDSAVPRGEVVSVTVTGGDGAELDLVLWRGTDGRPCAMEARCPHQWSHLGAEGVLDGDEIVCTAHFWRFDRTGRGTKLNLAGRRDLKADLAVYGVREVDGAVHIRLPGP